MEESWIEISAIGQIKHHPAVIVCTLGPLLSGCASEFRPIELFARRINEERGINLLMLSLGFCPMDEEDQTRRAAIFVDSR